MRAEELVDALRAHYPKTHGWVLLPQVRDATGAGGGRTADAIALNAWPSRGLELHGFELKTYRGDWLRELKQPAKAESIFRYCDRWWIVTPEPVGNQAVVKPSELPPTWGYLTVGKSGAGVEVDAPKLTPAALDRVFLAAILRALAKCEAPEAALENAFAAGRKEGFDAGIKHAALRMRPAELEMVRWKRESLENLEKSAKRIADSIRAELRDLRNVPDLPDASNEDEKGALPDVHTAGQCQGKDDGR